MESAEQTLTEPNPHIASASSSPPVVPVRSIPAVGPEAGAPAEAGSDAGGLRSERDQPLNRGAGAERTGDRGNAAADHEMPSDAAPSGSGDAVVVRPSEARDSKTLRERIVDGLREAIVRGEIAPGSRLQEVDVAERYSTSRTPVREAFRQLESEGFVRIRARRGAVVTSMTAKDVREFYEIKSVLEGYAARRATTALSRADVDRMEKLNAELERAFERGDIERTVEVHNQFHEVFVRAAGNDRLLQLVTGLVQQFQRFRISLSHTDSVRDSIALHREIIEAFRDRDAARAEELVARNSHQGSDALIQALIPGER